MFLSSIWRVYLQEAVKGLLHAYASILFSQHAHVGLLFLLATFWFPNTGVSGLLAALTGILTANMMRFSNIGSGLHIYNSLLVGLSLGAVYQLDIYLAILIIMGAVMAVFMSVALADWLWRIDRLPALSLPFVVVALTTAFAAQGYGTLSHYLLPMAPHAIYFTEAFDHFFTAMGSAFFMPNPVAGALFFLGILITSRYLALLALGGFIAGYGVFAFLSGSQHPDLVAWTGFNFVLTAMVIGGIFSVPSWQSFVLAMVGSMMAALLTTAAQSFMLVYGLPVMALPFLITSLCMLIALQKRVSLSPPHMLMNCPNLPEKSYEDARLARVRHGDVHSVPLHAPHMGLWSIYQGFDGQHTHCPPWQHALDFYIVENAKSYANEGYYLTDYFCFSLPVVAPAYGHVVACVAHLPDNHPGEVDTQANWGNHILIQLQNGLYVLLAHLQQHSLLVHQGDMVNAGMPVARCGNSGRSPQPHIHLHVQRDLALGSPTIPFHLSASMLRAENGQMQFKLFARPKLGDVVAAMDAVGTLAHALHLPVGRSLQYQVMIDGQTLLRSLTVKLTLTGEFRLHSDQGASAAFCEDSGILAFYDRQGSPDFFFDVWVLSVGLTPLSEGQGMHLLSWRDAPAMAWMPVTLWQKILLLIRYPLGGGLKSTYQRRQGALGQWLQSGEHQLILPLLKPLVLHTNVMMSDVNGIAEVSAVYGQKQVRAVLELSGFIADEGVPASYHSSTL
ncbi:MAG: urea transporter [Mariprofundaceae bacterium]|nr:urea transporter [Mariprofundaceae bacterium]